MAQVEPSPNLPPAPLTVEEFCFLANTFTDQGAYEKAIRIYESALRIYPENLALKINLGRVRSLRNEVCPSPEETPRGPREREAFEGTAWADRFQGLGEIFRRHGRPEEAHRIFELSKASTPNFFLPYLNLGRLFLEQGDLPSAVSELERARSLNPFDAGILDLLGEARFRNRDYREALDCAIDAFILSGEAARPGLKGPYRSRIKECMSKLPEFTAPMRNERIRERRNRINARCEELEEALREAVGGAVGPADKEPNGQGAPELRGNAGPVQDGLAAGSPDEIGRAREVALLLRKHLLFRNMAEEAVLKVAMFSSPIEVRRAEFVYQEGDPVYGFYLVDRGKVELQKKTPYGAVTYSTFESGSFFGDDSLVTGHDRHTSALAVDDSVLLFVDKAGLARIFARERAIAIHFLWYFWTSLSRQIREANDRMTGFFAGEPESARREIAETALGPSASLEIDRKREVLQAKGLSAGELDLLGPLGEAERFNRGEAVFREGDLGDRLYIVLEGSVLLSKQVPGDNEETLALLRKGDFFGEMALVGRHFRSADAKALEQGTALLAIGKEAVRRSLSLDTESACRFLTILCRILARRLGEIDEKIYHWKIMSGGFG